MGRKAFALPPSMKALFVARVQMMMPDIGRIGEHEIETLVGRLLLGEIALYNA